jgi:hypothetical protein
MSEGINYDLSTSTVFTKQIKNRIFSYVKEICTMCRQERDVRVDKWLTRKTDLCIKCNGKKNLPKPPTIHGLSRTRLYHKYKSMVYRCYNTNQTNFIYYGGRGIGVCDEWLSSENGLQNFISWSLVNGYKPDLQIDRINNDGDYSPNNCRFITAELNKARMKDLFGVPGRVSKNHIDDHPKISENKKEKTIEACLSDNDSNSSEKLVPLSDWLNSF